MNFHDILFYAFYDLMRRQGNRNPEDDKTDGLVGGAIFLSIVPFTILGNIVLILKHLHAFPWIINKAVVIIFGILFMGANILYFRSDKRYLKIENAFNEMGKKKRRYYLFTSWSVVLLLFIVFFLFAYL